MVSLDDILAMLSAVIEASEARLTDEMVGMADAGLCELAEFISTTDATPPTERHRVSVEIISYISTRASLWGFERK